LGARGGMSASKQSADGLWAQLRRFDAHPKALEDFRVHTRYGGVVSLVAIALMLLLSASELRYTMQRDLVDRLFVNSTRKQELAINFDITFPKIHCSLIGVDVNDQIGNPQDGVKKSVNKRSLSSSGEVIGEVLHEDTKTLEHESEFAGEGGDGDAELQDGKGAGEKAQSNCGDCYGAGEEGQCCNTCDDVRLAYQRRGWSFDPASAVQCKSEEFQMLELQKSGQGCRLKGEVEVTSVAGNFHFAPAERLKSSHRNQAEALKFTFQQFNVSHTIHKLSFGREFPGIRDPLDDHSKVITDGYGMYQYFVKVVPTTYRYLNDEHEPIVSNQYSVTEHLRHVTPGSDRGLPGVFFFYDISPIHAIFEERRRRGWSQFFTSIFAICGGLFVCLGFVNDLLHSATKRRRPSPT